MGIEESKPCRNTLDDEQYMKVSEFELRSTDTIVFEEKCFLIRYYWIRRNPVENQYAAIDTSTDPEQPLDGEHEDCGLPISAEKV